jgi:hypothetical protein
VGWDSLGLDADAALSSSRLESMMLPAMARVGAACVRDVLANVSAIATTFDGWCDVGRRPYLGITAHFFLPTPRGRCGTVQSVW